MSLLARITCSHSALRLMLCLLTPTFLVPSNCAYAAWLGEVSSDIWQFASTKRSSHWLVIYHRATANLDGIDHIEMLERAVAPIWKIKHLVPHMTVSVTALRASIIKPSKRGAFSWTFDLAYAAWKAQQTQLTHLKTVICESSVMACLK